MRVRHSRQIYISKFKAKKWVLNECRFYSNQCVHGGICHHHRYVTRNFIEIFNLTGDLDIELTKSVPTSSLTHVNLTSTVKLTSMISDQSTNLELNEIVGEGTLIANHANVRTDIDVKNVKIGEFWRALDGNTSLLIYKINIVWIKINSWQKRQGQ